MANLHGSIDPVAWQNPLHPDQLSSKPIPNWMPLYAAPVAQQPQARPDFTDEWTGYLKDGETPFERFLRERKDLTALTKLYQRALEENGRLKTQQPQAEAVPSDVVRDAERWRTFLATRPANTHAVINDAIDAAMAKGEKS